VTGRAGEQHLGSPAPAAIGILHAKPLDPVMPLPSAAGEPIAIMSQLETGEERRVFRVAMALCAERKCQWEKESRSRASCTAKAQLSTQWRGSRLRCSPRHGEYAR
jgi:hypothetical protein